VSTRLCGDFFASHRISLVECKMTVVNTEGTAWWTVSSYTDFIVGDGGDVYVCVDGATNSRIIIIIFMRMRMVVVELGSSPMNRGGG
jgi:hypothetical protein